MVQFVFLQRVKELKRKEKGYFTKRKKEKRFILTTEKSRV